MSWLLDTCVLSEQLRPRPELKVTHWLSQRAEEELFISSLTVGEIHKGALLQKEISRRRQIEKSLTQIVHRFGDRVLAIDADVAVAWASLQTEAKDDGLILPVVDALLAATALAHDLVFVTRNLKDVHSSRVRTFNPWQ